MSDALYRYDSGGGDRSSPGSIIYYTYRRVERHRLGPATWSDAPLPPRPSRSASSSSVPPILLVSSVPVPKPMRVPQAPLLPVPWLGLA